jgi:hypothetical protein
MLLSPMAGPYARALLIAGGLTTGFTVVSAFSATRDYLSEQFPTALRGLHERCAHVALVDLRSIWLLLRSTRVFAAMG